MQLDPHHGTPTYHQAVHEIDSACNRVFERQKERALAKNRSLSKARVWKSEDESSDYSSKEYAEAIYEFIEVEFREMPALVRPALEDAMLSGLLNGLLQLEIHDTKLIAEVNTVARDYAADRAAELVGMKYNHDGELVANPRAEWAISDTTRDKIKRVVTEAFEGETKIADVAAKIEKALEEDGAGIFTAQRAQTIANTEVAFAQAHGNWTTWEKSGLVREVKWLVSNEGPCDVCEGNEGEVREFNATFPSGDKLPPAHPNCLVGDVVVSASDRITKLFKRRFHGEVVTLRMSTGENLTVTPNHQILTNAGWQSARDIKKGFHVAQCGREAVRLAASNPDDHLMPTVVEQVSRTLLESRSMSSGSMPTTAEDFHGDASFDGEVEIISPQSLLKLEVQSFSGEKLGELTLCGRHARRLGFNAESTVGELASSVPHPPDSIVRGLSDFQSLPLGSLTHTQSHRSASVAHQEAELLESSANGGTVNADHPSQIHARFARDIDFVEVTDASFAEFDGHVYNLETESGYYFAEGLIVHNCRCVLIATKVGDE